MSSVARSKQPISLCKNKIQNQDRGGEGKMHSAGLVVQRAVVNGLYAVTSTEKEKRLTLIGLLVHSCLVLSPSSSLLSLSENLQRSSARSTFHLRINLPDARQSSRTEDDKIDSEHRKARKPILRCFFSSFFFLSLSLFLLNSLVYQPPSWGRVGARPSPLVPSEQGPS